MIKKGDIVKYEKGFTLYKVDDIDFNKSECRLIHPNNKIITCSDIESLRIIKIPKKYKGRPIKYLNYLDLREILKIKDPITIESNKKEKLLPIYGYIDYHISNFGRVVSLINPYEEKLISYESNTNGYQFFRPFFRRIPGSSEASARRVVSVTNVVSVAFLPNPKNKLFVKHIDGDVSNNNVSNLKWTKNGEMIYLPDIHQGVYSYLNMYSLEEVIEYGKHMGLAIHEMLVKDPFYIEFCIVNSPIFCIDPDIFNMDYNYSFNESVIVINEEKLIIIKKLDH